MENSIAVTFFIDAEHKSFYKEALLKCKLKDVYHKALIYCLGISEDTRNHIEEIYDFNAQEIKTDAIIKPWQTSGSLQITRLAFNLFTDGTPTIYEYKDGSEEQINESRKYSVSDIFCTSLAPYFYEAVKIRYPVGNI